MCIRDRVRAAVAAGGRDNVTAVVVDAVAVSASASATAQAEDTLSDELWIGPDDDTVPEATDHVFVENGETVG